VGDGEGHPEQGVGPEPTLVVGAVGVEHRLVDTTLVGGLEAEQDVGELAVDVGDRGGHALAAEAVAAVAQLDGLELAGARPGGHDRPAARAGFQLDLHLDGGIAA